MLIEIHRFMIDRYTDEMAPADRNAVIIVMNRWWRRVSNGPTALGILKSINFDKMCFHLVLLL